MSRRTDIVAAVLLASLATRAHAGAPAGSSAAQALVAEGDRQLQAHAYDQALANFLAAYAATPDPKLLLRIADALRDLGRFADVANTLQRYLSDPQVAGASDADAAQVKQQLAQLDPQLTLLTVRVFPRGSELSLDGGPFVAVGSALVTRVRPGLHLVRIRQGERINEVTLNGFDGEAKDVVATLPVLPAPAPAPAPSAAPDRVLGWLITGTQYATSDPAGRAREVHAIADGHVLAALAPHDEPAEHPEATPAADEEVIGSGVIGVARIDGEGRGFAGGFGIVLARGNLEAEIMVLKSEEVGGYVGLRYRLFTGTWRPYFAGGVPGFVFDHQELQPDMSVLPSKRLAVGLRAAAGLEVRITRHVSVEGDLGYEHFFFTDDHYEADVFVPTVGVIGRL
jgi:hypothetical protein